MSDEAVKNKILNAVVVGDLRQFKALSKTFSDALEDFRYDTSDTNLVEAAWKHRRDDVLVNLIVEHGFEVSPEFEKKNKLFTGELNALGVNEYHQTLELLAGAIVKTASDAQRNLACYAVKEWALGGGKSTQALSADTIPPELSSQIKSGNLEAFAKRRYDDERYQYIQTAHSSRMVAAIKGNIQAIEANIKPPLNKGEQDATASSVRGRG